jgi:RND family efflux transporter MFP subunit
MNPQDQRRPDLSALRIERDREEPQREHASGRIIGLTLTAIVLLGLGVLAWLRWVVPMRAPLVESVIVKKTVNVANPPLLTATGYLVASKQSKITPKISGKVVKLNFDVGSKVRGGDVLAVLESSNLKAQLDEAEAAEREAAREYARQIALSSQGISSKSLLDSAEAQIKGARARVEQIQINMQDMVVRAPFDGTIATKNTEVGEVISSVMMGQVAGTLPSGAICTLVDLRTLEVEADVNEGNIGQLHEGQPAEVTVDAFPGRKWKGQLRQIVPTADRAKAIVKVKVSIINPDARLLPEMSSSVSFLLTERTSSELTEVSKIWLPPSAIVDGRVAVIGADKRVKWTRVTPGVTRDGRVEVTSGLSGGERVVTSGGESLKEGQLVKVSQ